LTVAAGKSVYLFDGVQPGRLLKRADFGYEVASAAVNSESGRLVTGSASDTWARVYDLNTDEELGMSFTTSPSHSYHCFVLIIRRGSKGPPWPHLVCQLLSRWQDLRHRQRRRHHQTVEGMPGAVRPVAVIVPI
jgi:hypothetical protein